MSFYTTGEVARLCGVSVRAVQYYDARGILSPTELTEGGRRLYSEEDLGMMRIVCQLRELDLSLESIARLLKEENSGRVISMILEEQARQLTHEISEKQAKLERLRDLLKALGRDPDASVKSIGDITHVMENKKKLTKMRLTMLLTGIPVTALQWVSIIMWITNGMWWLFAAWAALAVAYGVWVSKLYFKSVAYICPDCHEVFEPRLGEAFWAANTPNTRRLTCPNCGKRSYCLETYRRNEK